MRRSWPIVLILAGLFPVAVAADDDGSITIGAKNFPENRLLAEIVKFVTQVAARFQIQVSEKAAAQSVPAIGALGGALVNYVFMDHFQNMARGHFTVRRLERTYSPELIEAKYHDV